VQKFAIDPEDPAINDKASRDAGKELGADTGTKLGADKETPGKCVESASLVKTAKGVSAPIAGVPAPAKQDAKRVIHTSYTLPNECLSHLHDCVCGQTRHEGDADAEKGRAARTPSRYAMPCEKALKGACYCEILIQFCLYHL